MKIILVGNQNSGKTTIFNYLTDSKEKVGNWPGVTINSKMGMIKKTNHTLMDLPGIYSLSPYSNEEYLSTNFILNNYYDLIINVMDINILERSLYLTLELLELGKNIIIVLTHTNFLNKKDVITDIKLLEQRLRIKVIDFDDIKRDKNILFNSFLDIKSNNSFKVFSNDIESIIYKLSNNRYNSINIIKNNKLYSNLLENKYNMNINELLSYQRYKYIESITNDIIIKSKNSILDKILLNKIIGIPIFILIMLFIYYFSIGIVGNNINYLINNIINNISKGLINVLYDLNVYEWLIDLIVNGIINGVVVIINFIPQLLILFIFMEILKQTGYIIRITYLLDGILNKIGLSGKSIISFIVGSSCSVPGIMQSRIIDNKIKRDRTIILTPFIPCTAKLPIIIMIFNCFFQYSYFIIIVYLLAIIMVILASLLLKRLYTTFDNSFVMELPNYNFPKFKYILNEVIYKIKEFIKRISSIVLISSIIIWIFCKYPSYDNSILLFIGKKISFIFYPFLGVNNWKLSVSILQGLIAKEQVVSSLNIISNNNISSLFTPISALSFLTFNLFSIPCINTISVMKAELGSISKLILCLLFQFVIAFLLSTIIYQVGNIIW